MPNHIVQKQNKPELIVFLRASTVAYSKAKKWETLFGITIIFLAIAYPVFYVVIKDKVIELILFGFSFFFTILLQLLSGFLEGSTYLGAILKEEFDTALFGLRWKSTIQKLPHAETLNLHLQYQGREIKDWYSINLSPDIPLNIAIAVCQHSNTIWDVELRKLLRIWLISLVSVYSLFLFTLLVFMNLDGLTFFFIAFSVVSFYTHFLNRIHGHNRVIKKRESISIILDKMILSKTDISAETLRDIQDEIFSTRSDSEKVPDFFFKLYHHRLNRISEAYIQSVNQLYDQRNQGTIK